MVSWSGRVGGVGGGGDDISEVDKCFRRWILLGMRIDLNWNIEELEIEAVRKSGKLLTTMWSLCTSFTINDED